MPEDIKKLSEEVAKMGATIIDMVLSWCKETGHNPYFILSVIGQRMLYHSLNSDFSEYKPTYGGFIRQMDNESLAERMFELVEQVKECGFDEAESIKGLTTILSETYEDYSKE